MACLSNSVPEYGRIWDYGGMQAAQENATALRDGCGDAVVACAQKKLWRDTAPLCKMVSSWCHVARLNRDFTLSVACTICQEQRAALSSQKLSQDSSFISMEDSYAEIAI